MLLERLEMTNFKRFRNAEIHFRDGITGIIGNNGTGKSSIVEAILFALYGVKGSGISSEYIVSSFAGPGEVCEVRLDFAVGGTEYSVYRMFRKGKHEAELYFRPERSDAGMRELVKSVSEVSARIQEIIGMGPADFRNTIYAAQKDLLALLETQPYARKEWFMKALGIEHLRTRSDEVLKERADRTENLLRIQETKAATLGEEGDIARLDEFRTLLAGREEEERVLTGQRTQARAVSEGLDELRAVRQALDYAGQRVAAEEAACERLAEDRRRLSAIQDRIRSYREQEQELARLREQEPHYRNLIDEIRTLESGIEQKKSRWHQVMDELDSFCPVREELASLSGTPALLEDRRARERAQLEARGLEQARQELEARAGEIRESIRQLGIRISDLEALTARYTRAQEELAGAERLYRQCTGKHADLSARIGLLRKEITARREDYDRIGQAGSSGACPLCHQTLGANFDALVREYDRQLHSLDDDEQRTRAELGAVAEESALLEEQIRTIRVEAAEIDRARLALADLSARREAEAASLTLAVSQIARKEGEIHRLGIDRYDPRSQQALEEEIAVLESVMVRRSEMTAMLGREPVLGAERDSLVDEIKACQARLGEKRAALAEIGYDDTRKRDLEAALEALRPLRDEFIGITDRLSREPEIVERLGTARAEQASLRTRERGIGENLAALGWTGRDHTAVKAALHAIEDTLRTCCSEKTRLAEQIFRLELLQAQLEAATAEAARLRDELELLRATRKIVAEYIVYLMHVVRSRIEVEVGRILGEITSGRYDRVLIDEDFNLLIRDIDNDYPVGRFSGGEQDDIAVALRIALSRYLAHLHRVHENTFLIFDEIFGSQDEERRNSLLLALRSQEAYFPQILLISHIPEMQGEFANALLVELGSDQASRIQEVNQ